MNYNHSKPFIPVIPPPPALPRFTLPNEGSEEGVDPLDVAATTQRPALDATRARRVVRRAGTPPSLRPSVRADATSEVQVEDILLEVYKEEPPPPTRRSTGVPERRERTSGAAILAAAPLHNADVDALLRASGAAFVPFGGHSQPPPPPHQWSADADAPSVAPVAFPSVHIPLSGPHHPMAAPSADPSPRGANAVRAVRVAGRRSGAAIAIWTVVLLVFGLAAGAGGAVAVRNGTYARLRDGAKAAAARAGSKPSAPAAQPVTPSQPVTPPVAMIAPPAAPVAEAPTPVAEAPAPLPSVSVSSLPQPTVAADSSLVTFPVSAQGHRVFFDGRPMAVTSAPMKLRCGRHMIRIGSTGKARVTDLACGREVTLLK